MNEKELQSDKEIAKEIFLRMTDGKDGILTFKIINSQSPIDEACAYYKKILDAVKEA